MPHDNSSYRTILPGLPPEAYAWLERPMPRPTGLTWHAAERLTERLPEYFDDPDHARDTIEPLLFDAEPNPFQTVQEPASAAWRLAYERHYLGLAVVGHRANGRNVLTVIPRIIRPGEPAMHEKYRWNPTTKRFDFRAELRRKHNPDYWRPGTAAGLD